MMSTSSVLDIENNQEEYSASHDSETEKEKSIRLDYGPTMLVLGESSGKCKVANDGHSQLTKKTWKRRAREAPRRSKQDVEN
ncbi:hypothetical protein TorRG33x02_332040 [Trema orientale]|uniref:Uncharacterized protein n=1 Tax=Trema orientale TaxID=63057 RepID=A0A2P5B5L7_TREOI|nr:hypothetical protein TorRG33x02_332040 [Trema orientale]